MKKLLFLLSIFVVVLSCSSDEKFIQEAQFNIEIIAGEGGEVSTNGGMYDLGQTVNVRATPLTDYLFINWSDGNINNPRLIKVASNITITANFEKKKYPLTVNIEGEGEVLEEIVNSGRSTDYDLGTTVKLTAIPGEGWNFKGWAGAIESDELEIQLIVNKSKEITAIFDPIIISLNAGDLIYSFPSELGFNSNIEFQETENYKIKKGWLSIKSVESHDGGFYLTNNIKPGYFMIDFMPIFNIDLNKDGMEDMVLRLKTIPHTIRSKSSSIPFFALINNGDGTFNFSQDYFESNFVREPINVYRTLVEDFNGDGVLDFICGMIGEPVINNVDGGTNSKPALPIVALSNINGKYIDGSENLIGMYPQNINDLDDLNKDGVPDFLSDRAIASGDFNNDGFIDLFMVSRIFYNDGKGIFNINGSQISNQMIPSKLDPPYSNTYEAFSDDFNNDGFDDIIIAPDSGFISRNGGSGWVVMSNGTPDVSSWIKVNLPDPRYLNNTKLNHMKSIDFNNDGFRDLILASTRESPYYSGAGIQLLKNNGDETFSDVTSLNVSDQTHMDQWHGEGDLIIIDVNNDGALDIVHLTGNTSDSPPNIHHGTNIYINKSGFFELYDTDNKLPFVWWAQFKGWESFIKDVNFYKPKLDNAFPININNDGWLDFISYKKQINSSNNPTPGINVFYTIESKN